MPSMPSMLPEVGCADAMGAMDAIRGISWLLLAALVAGCGDPPFEPGSDLPDEAPPAVLSDAPPIQDAPPPAPAPDLDPAERLDGEYALTASLQSPLGDAIEARFLARVTQYGEADSATIDIELADPIEPDVIGPTTAEPVALDADRAFHAVVSGLTIDPRFSDLLRAPAEGEVTLDGQPIAADCLAGRLSLALIDAQVTVVDGPVSLSLEGTFTAERAPGACPGGS